MRNKLKAHATCVLRIALAHVLLIPGADAAMPQPLLARGSFSPRPALHLFSYFHFNALQPWCPCTLAQHRTPRWLPSPSAAEGKPLGHVPLTWAFLKAFPFCPNISERPHTSVSPCLQLVSVGRAGPQVLLVA